MKLTPEQKKMNRRYQVLQNIIEKSSKEQQRIRPLATTGDYTQLQRENYARYQQLIDKANAEIAELKALAYA